jgi:hypothetical protein
MEIRKLITSDYDTLCEWWGQWGWAAPPIDFLPEEGCGGFIVEDNGVGICAGFAYITNSKVGWSEFIISNKEYKSNDRSEAIDLLIETINLLLKNMGCKYVYTSVKNTALINRYKKHGFSKNDECIEMTKIL